jgi:hypothetical protein
MPYSPSVYLSSPIREEERHSNTSTGLTHRKMVSIQSGKYDQNNLHLRLFCLSFEFTPGKYMI